MSYSQNNEEQVIVDYFKGKVGTFLDVGANDGLTLSNTRRLMELKWSGVCVEPSPTAFKKLKENTAQFQQFQKVYCYNFALGTSNGKVKMWDSGTHLNNGDHGLLSTINSSEKERWPGQVYEEIEVQCYRWKTFLNRLSVKEFSFISLDIEGCDVQVLKQIDLRNTELLCIEWNGNENIKQQILEYTSGYGMSSVIYTSPENLIISR